MSYLDLPRLHFSGAYYVDVATRNNATMNYLNQSENLFDELTNTTWNPNGQNVIYLRGCKIRSMVDQTGTTSSMGDPLIGARLESQGPYSDLATLGAVPTSNPKLSDYDSDQQYRSQINGMWLGVLFNGEDGQIAGFYGFLNPSNLRDLGGKVFPGANGSYSAAGNFGARLTQITWVGNPANSPLFLEFQKSIEASAGIAVRFILDLYQGARQKPDGGDYGYGRIQGSFGPALAWECEQLVPGRRLDVPPATGTVGNGLMAIHGDPDQAKPETVAPPLPGPNYWMPAFAQVRRPSMTSEARVLSLDLGPAVPVKGNLNGFSDGSLCVEDFVVGYGDSSQSFVPFKQGAVSLGGNQVKSNSSYKSFFYLNNSGVVDIPLDPDEITAIASSPLQIQTSTGEIVLIEQAEGIYIDIDPPAIRMEQGESRVVHLQYLRFGQAGSLPFPLDLQSFAVRWHGPYPNPSQSFLAYRWRIEQPADIEFEIGAFNQYGIAPVTVTALSGAMNLNGPRVDMASRINFVLNPNSPFGYPPAGTWQQPEGYAEPATGLEFFTVLVWQTLVTPTSLTWEKDIGPILQQFARLYPGMVTMLNIGDKDRVIQNSQLLVQVLSKVRNDPAYMPVTRELSPSRINMIIKWLEEQG